MLISLVSSHLLCGELLQGGDFELGDGRGGEATLGGSSPSEQQNLEP